MLIISYMYALELVDTDPVQNGRFIFFFYLYHISHYYTYIIQGLLLIFQQQI